MKSFVIDYDCVKRCIDVIGSLLLGFFFAPLAILISVLIKLTSTGPVLYWSSRVGLDNAIFSMPKFRTMQLNTPEVATHLLSKPQSYLTPIGSFLRKTSLDELPQLICIFRGTMSFVGPRPALFNQDDLISLRTSVGVHTLRPGLTGWAQVNGRDLVSIHEKVLLDEYYSKNISVSLDIKIIIMTIFNTICAAGVKH